LEDKKELTTSSQFEMIETSQTGTAVTLKNKLGGCITP
jgi:hypothetical protein